MKTYSVEVRVWLKPSVFDPQGHAVEQAMHTLGYAEASDLRIGKYMQLTVQAESEAEAELRTQEMCERVLSNPVMETFAFTLKELVAE
ncbi:phosphoribosylformylglycinamidine synthase subunit PurS [Alicyclobacillus dauci]|uniref:Phosphoribosylformylglycinamidine synthase subunit PurS n=1 Tax=Alicyclobacillus dauci TaxID=1475485 RepID=A0ABY6Z193_9BACL|nr:phosphoribosylformylglycinamidine synthase subunit PurS [Alicyclobacillus dauci]WAH36649.1 phosphoribosylformylglycinamidine synthase subunit PurS [Alicyclobacillus dauci]